MKRYDQEFKRDAVIMLINNGKPLKQISHLAAFMDLKSRRIKGWRLIRDFRLDLPLVLVFGQSAFISVHALGLWLATRHEWMTGMGT